MRPVRRLLLTACATLSLCLCGAAWAKPPRVIVYDDFSKPGPAGYTINDYAAKWANPFGLGEMASTGGDTRSFKGNQFSISAVPFTVGADFSVFDHLKYIAISTQSFAVPARGSITFSSVIQAETPGTQPGRVIHGTYLQSGLPYAQPTLEGQQAGAVMNMIDFATGQLFDWFVSGGSAFTLVERLPSNVANGLPPGAPGYVGREKMYTQIVDEVKVGPGPHKVAIRYTRDGGRSFVEFFLNGHLVSRVDDVGVPLDVQGRPYTGIYPALGPGEKLVDQVNSFSIGHGLFSLLDAFPFQHPEAPELSVSIPLANRLFGQGARASFDRFMVEIVEFD
jgi:opacity protein-like surface antigen